jgi:hypothetical protein
MKYLLKLVFCIAVLVSAGGVDVYGAVRIVGDGGISFDGTGSLLVQRFPELVFE